MKIRISYNFSQFWEEQMWQSWRAEDLIVDVIIFFIWLVFHFLPPSVPAYLMSDNSSLHLTSSNITDSSSNFDIYYFFLLVYFQMDLGSL